MRNVKSYLFVSACYTLSTLCGACSLLQRDAAKDNTGSASEAAPATMVSAQAPEKPEKPQKAAGNPFGITSTIVPATMPLAGTGAAMPSTAATATNTAAATAAASGSGADAASAGTGAVAAAAAGDGAVAAAAGTSGSAMNAGSAFDPATFDEAHGRSKGTAPLGTPVEAGGMECPNEVCKPLPPLPDQATAAGASISLCCSPEGECGTKGMAPMSMMGGSMMNDPDKCRIIPDSDPQCARVIVMDFEIASCCTPEGQCGINSDGFMMAKPCTSIEEANMNIGMFITLPPPAACLPGMGPPHSSSAPAPGSSTTSSDAGAAGASAAESGASTAAAGSGASAPTAGSPATQSSAGSAAP